ncbi:hypothetical protein TWF481_007506 [Arthrobotrys musiformis]|uniref:Uncharacterized protein n=1 Tax=Arthrobotrys musiformis TaxID=47236 RepID=A0AAV9WBN0_9PEZI
MSNQPYSQNPFGSAGHQQLPPGQQLQQYYQQKARTPSLPNAGPGGGGGGSSSYSDQGLSPGQFQALPADYGQGLSPPPQGGRDDLSDDPSKLSRFFKDISFGNRTTKDKLSAPIGNVKKLTSDNSSPKSPGCAKPSP